MDPTAVSESDASLLAAFAGRRDEAAFTELVRRHGGMVFSVCRSVLGDISESEEAAQAVFLTLAQKSSSANVQAHLVGWLHRVAWYVAARASEARATRRWHEREASRMRTEIEPLPSKTVDLEALHAGLAKLPERYRVPLILHHLEGRSHQETAEIAGCSLTAIAVRLHRGREMLRNRMNKRGATVSLASLAAGAWGLPAMEQMPVHFAVRTTQAAVAATGGSVAATAVVSAKTAALANQAIAMLLRAKLQSAALLLLAVLLLGGITRAALHLWPIQSPPAAVVIPPAVPTLPNLPTLPAVSGSVQTITGMITRVDNGSLDILRRNNQTVLVQLTGDTVVKIDDKPATVADLKSGMSTAAMREAGHPATEIRAYTATGPGPAK